MRKGDKVVFNNKYGLDKKYTGVYTVMSDPWSIGGKEVVKVEAFCGAFCIDGLHKVKEVKL